MGAALDPRCEVIEGQLGLVLDGVSAVATRQAVAEVDGHSLLRANPVHPLVVLVSVLAFGQHGIAPLCVLRSLGHPSSAGWLLPSRRERAREPRGVAGT